MDGNAEEMINADDIESYKHQHESRTEWNLRRTFMLAHLDTIPKDRLLCLASCFINVECYGCRYPAQVMSELRELAMTMKSDIDDYRNNIRCHQTMKFVKASGEENRNKGNDLMKKDAGAKDSDAGFGFQAEKIPGPSNKQSFATARPSTSSGAVFSSDCFQDQAKPGPSGKQSVRSDKPRNSSDSTCSAHVQYDTAIEAKFRNVNTKLKSIIDKDIRKHVVQAFSKSGLSPKHVFRTSDKVNLQVCDLCVDSLVICSGEANTRVAAMKQAYENAALMVLSQKFRVAILPDGSRKIELTNETMNADEIFSKKEQKQSLPKKKRKRMDSSAPASSYILHSFPGDNDIEALNKFAQFNKVNLGFDFSQKLSDGNVQCDITVNEEWLASGMAQARKEAKRIACVEALSKLRKTCWTIQVKEKDPDASSVTRDQLVGKQESSIPQSNLGSQMLRKMGWAGEGMGKDGSGITEPVSLKSSFHRQGFGLSSTKNAPDDFKKKVRVVLNNYLSSTSDEDLGFASDLSKEERAVIHQESQRLSLATHSYGTGDDRYIVVKRKWKAWDLFHYLQQHGGETSKYKLIPPDETADDTEMAQCQTDSVT